MTDYVPIRVTIGLKPAGGAKYPDWKSLPLISGGANIKDHVAPIGWVYDKQSGHQDKSAETPIGKQHGLFFVTNQFANEAMTNIPAEFEITVLDETQVKSFWDNRAYKHVSRDNVNSTILSDLKAELDLKKALGQNTKVLENRIARALDGRDSEPGIRKNPLRFWVDAKVHLDINIIPLT